MDPMERVADKAKNASETLINQELGSQVNSALETLPFRQKSVFVLRYLEGLSLDEIAESLHLSIGAVKSNLWQACQKMRAKLGGMLQ